jgi:hypothetical protein
MDLAVTQPLQKIGSKRSMLSLSLAGLPRVILHNSASIRNDMKTKILTSRNMGKVYGFIISQNNQ